MVARNILNFGIGRLRLVDPGCDHRTGNTMGYASGAGDVLLGASVFPTLDLAVQDFRHVFAVLSTSSASMIVASEGASSNAQGIFATHPSSAEDAAAEAILLAMAMEDEATACALVFGCNDEDLRGIAPEPRRVHVKLHDKAAALELPQSAPPPISSPPSRIVARAMFSRLFLEQDRLCCTESWSCTLRGFASSTG